MGTLKSQKRDQRIMIELIREVALNLEKSSDELEILILTGNMVSSIYPGICLIITHIPPGANYCQVIFQKGFDGIKEDITSLMGFDVFSSEFSFSDLSPENLKFSRTGKLNLVKNGLHSLKPLSVPETVVSKGRKALGIDKVYLMGMVHEQNHYGNCTLFTRKSSPLYGDDLYFIETMILLATLALQRTRATQSIVESEDRYRLLIENAPVAIMIHRKGIIEYVNKAGIRLLKAGSSEELMGTNAMDLLHPDDKKMAMERIGQMYRTGESAPIAEERFFTMDKCLITLQVAASIIQYKGGPASLVFGLDVTNLKEAEAQVRAYSRELEEANIAKDKFFSIIAHDLKGPFNSILGFSDILFTEYDEYTDDERKHFIRNICSAAHNSFRLLENLLEWSRAQTNRMEFKQEVLEISSIINDILLLLKDQAESKDIHMFSAVEYNTRVFADENMVKTILRNLLSNAIKYSKRKGNIRIMERSFSDPESGKDMVEILVRDEGIGISQEVLVQLFRIDRIIKTSGTENETGTGLGLLLCKELVERNQGRITAESKSGEGSIFSFTLLKA
jgi:PAS domain S-box-containing protein